MWKTTAVLVACSTLLGCAGALATASAASTGCPEEEIAISDATGGFGTSRTWTAACHDRRYACSELAGSVTCIEDHRVIVPPSPVAAPTAPPPAAVTGCQYDTQCKGDRICQDGKCVEPSPAPAATPPVTIPAPASSAAKP